MKQRYSKSSGYVLVLFALVLGVLLSIAGVAVDIGNLYIIRNRLERAAKAGALAGVGYRSLRGWEYFSTYAAGGATPKSTAITTELFNVISGVVTENMQSAFSAPIAASEFTSNLTVTNANFYDPQTDTFTINATYQAPTFIIGRLGAALGAAPCPKANDGQYRCTIKIPTQIAQLNRAVVALLLDVSGSMNCPSTGSPNCACRTSTTPCPSTGRVIDALVAALKEFRGFFNPIRDYITVIPFNLAAFNSFPIVLGTVASGPPISFGNTQARYDDFMNNKTSLAGLTPKSNTNICDAFIEAIAELKRINNLADFHPFVIAFTDGAPNAFRGEFTGAVVNTAAPTTLGDLRRDNNLTQTSTTLTNDWYQYGLEWSTATTPLTTYRGPGPLVNRQLIGGKPRLVDHIISSTTGIWPTSSNVCGQAYSVSAQHPAILNFNATTTPVVPIKGCLSNLDFNIPGTDGVAGVSGVPIDVLNADTTTNLTTNLNYAKLPYYCAIEAADYIRGNLGTTALPVSATVYTIGVGNPEIPSSSDPFENVDNPLIRKDNFLARVALDPETLTGTNISKFDFQSTNTSSTCPETLPACYKPGSNTKKTTPDVQGEYFATQDANELRTLFSIIAKQILLRLRS